MTLIALYISKNFRTGGQKRYLELLTGLARRNHSVHLFHRKERPFPMELPENVILHPLRVTEGYSQQKAFTKALRQIPREDIQALNAQKILLFGDSSLLGGIYLKKLLKIPLVIAIRNNNVTASKIARKKSPGNIPSDLRNIYRERQTARHANRLIFQTVWDRDAIGFRSRYPLEKTAVIPNSVRAGWFDPEWRDTNCSEQLEHLVFVGSDSKRKGLDSLFKALDILRKKGRVFTLTLIGDFPRTDPAALPPDVILKGRLDSPLQALSAADLLVVPSLYDSFPNTVLESLFVGTPVIGTDVAGIKAMLEKDSLLFPSNDVQALADTLDALFDREAYGQAKKLCHERLKQFDFDWIPPWEEVLEKA